MSDQTTTPAAAPLTGLVGDLARWLDTQEIGWTPDPNHPDALIFGLQGSRDNVVRAIATPGVLHLFFNLTLSAKEGVSDELLMQAADAAAVRWPLPEAWDRDATYYFDEFRRVGLLVARSMPLRFSPDAAEDALALIYWVFNQAVGQQSA